MGVVKAQHRERRVVRGGKGDVMAGVGRCIYILTRTPPHGAAGSGGRQLSGEDGVNSVCLGIDRVEV